MAGVQSQSSDFRAKKAELERILDERDVDLLEDQILITYDKDGPLDNPEVSRFEPVDGIEAVAELEERPNICYALVSGWPIDMLQDFSRRYVDDGFDYFSGSLGTTVSTREGEIMEPSEPEIDARDIYQGVYEAAADEGVKTLVQPNRSSSVVSFKAEAESSERANTRFFADENISTRDIWRDLQDQDSGSFWYDSDSDQIVFENTLQDARILTAILTEEYNFPGLRFDRRNGEIAFSRDTEDREDYGLAEVHDFIEGAVSTDYQPPGLAEKADVHTNDDYGADVVIGDAGKYIGADALSDAVFGEDRVFHVHMGDSRSDFDMVKYSDVDGLFLPQQGTEAHRLSEEYWDSNEYVPLQDGVEYTRLFESLT